nr:class I SAM-dependent methyltransferase [uncultured Flavobacterium sp.]
MTRIEVLNAIIKKKDVKNYLEIGVNRGKCLFNIKGAEKRFAVDPFFNFNLWKKCKAILKNSDNLKNNYFEVTSDLFFEQNKELLRNNNINLAFIDGLHTYKQSLQDTINTMQYLEDGGIIVLHDCNPLDELAAYPAASIDEARKDLQNHKDWKNIWNGDVWKTIVFIQKNHPELSAFVLDTDHGLGFVYKKEREQLPEIYNQITSIDNLEYSFLEKNRSELLNLKPVSYFKEFLQ